MSESFPTIKDDPNKRDHRDRRFLFDDRCLSQLVHIRGAAISMCRKTGIPGQDT